MNLEEGARSQLDTLIRAHDVTLFMKGTRQQPQCGFSNTVIQILDSLITDYQTVDVLADSALRENIKAYSAWPTIPQLYVKGEFIGGCDIVREMHDKGELKQAVEKVLQAPTGAAALFFSLPALVRARRYRNAIQV